MAQLLDDRPEGYGREERKAADDDDDTDREADEHRVVGAESAERYRHDVFGRQCPAEGKGWDHYPEPADQHIDSPHDVVEGGIAREAPECGTVIVPLRREGIEDLAEAVRTGI